MITIDDPGPGERLEVTIDDQRTACRWSRGDPDQRCTPVGAGCHTWAVGVPVTTVDTRSCPRRIRFLAIKDPSNAGRGEKYLVVHRTVSNASVGRMVVQQADRVDVTAFAATAKQQLIRRPVK